jgi:hypothetical protein
MAAQQAVKSSQANESPRREISPGAMRFKALFQYNIIPQTNMRLDDVLKPQKNITVSRIPPA